MPRHPSPADAKPASAPPPQSLTTRDEWERRIRTLDPSAVAGVEPFAEVLLRHLPVDPSWHAIEIGAIPGRFLSFMNQAFGYRVTGLDSARDWSAFDEVMRRAGVTSVEKLEQDFLRFETDRTYQVVASFGLIEHFHDVGDIIHRHARLVAPGGFLVLSVPNFTHVQFLYHRLVDPANLELHNTRAMGPRRVERWVAGEGLRVVFSGHLGRMGFWHEAPALAPWQRVVDRVARTLARRLGPRLPVSAWYSPYFMLIARRDAGS